MDQYPPNNKKAKEVSKPDKKVERVIESEATVRKKPLGRQFTDTFIGGDAKSALNFVIFQVLVPAARDALAEAGSQGIERLIFGDSRRKASSTAATGHVSYNRFSHRSTPKSPGFMEISRRARATHDFGEILLQTRGEAEAVIEQLFEIVSRFGVVTVADLYDLIGLGSTHADNKWGWTELRGANVVKTRHGYLLDLPDTEPLD